MKRTKIYLTLLLFFMFFLNSCRKEGISYEELSRLAALKTEEAIALTKGHPCSNLSEWRIDTLYYTYVPVHPSFEEQYKKLQAEANELQRKANEAYQGPTRYNMSVVVLPPHFGLRCINGVIKVALPSDLERSEIDMLSNQLFKEITTFFDDTPCTDPSKWRTFPLLKNCEFIDVLYTDTPDFAVFGRKVEQHAHLEAAKRHLEGAVDCPTIERNTVKAIVCENGKPKVTY